MKVDEFLDLVDTVFDQLKNSHTKATFRKNLESGRIYQDESFAKWLQIYLAWNELSSDEDIERHWDLYE